MFRVTLTLLVAQSLVSRSHSAVWGADWQSEDVSYSSLAEQSSVWVSAYGTRDDFPEHANSPGVIIRYQDDATPQALLPAAASPVIVSAFGFTSLGLGIYLVTANQPLAISTSLELGRLLNHSYLTSTSPGPKRNPGTTGNAVNGQRGGRVAGGSYWFPARADLDTMLSKIDSRLIEEVKVVKGPYTVLEGPGFSFYDIEFLPAPRYENGFESHGSSILDYQTNGEQWHGRQNYWGGGGSWGFRVGYGHRTGVDYESGAGDAIPSSYKSRTPNLALSADLSESSRIDFHYMRLDQTDVEFPGQVYDMDFLVTDAYQIKYTLEDQYYFDRLDLEVWYNRTRLEGDNLSPAKRNFIPVLDNFAGGSLRGRTDVDAMSTGFRLAATWGDPQSMEVTSGVDLRYIKQELNDISGVDPGQPVANRPIPQSHSSTPGVFVESRTTVTDQLVVSAGTRVDWVSMNADETVEGAMPFDLMSPGVPMPSNLERALAGDAGEFNQHFNLWMGFLTAEYEFNSALTGSMGAGYAMRPPDMTEMYAFQPFLAVLPQFLFNAPLGNPTLDPEQLWQIDLGLQADYCCIRVGINGFHAWIQDYITYDNLSTPFAGNPAGLITFVNTELATLAGGDIYCEAEWTPCVTSFATLSYVEGRDHTRTNSNSPVRDLALGGGPRSGFAEPAEEPLPVIAPLESRIGVRLHEPVESPRYAVEFTARLVDNQDRIAFHTLGEQPTRGFSVYDIRSYWQYSESLQFTAGVENFTDVNYREHFDPRRRTLSGNFFQPGVNFYFGSELTY